MSKISRIKMYLIGALFLIGYASPTSAALIVNGPTTITDVVTVQPIIVSDDDGSNPANYFGNVAQQSSILSQIDTIWAQAGIDINFLTPNSWNNTFANEGDSSIDPATMMPRNDPRPTDDLDAIETMSMGVPNVRNADSNVINMFFVNIAAGFSLLSPFTAAGLAETPGNDITQYVGTSLLGFQDGRDVIASVVAHEIGHNLGLPHIVETENLMQTSSSPNQGERLNAIQIETALASPLSAPVPVPSVTWLFATGLIGLVGLRKFAKA